MRADKMAKHIRYFAPHEYKDKLTLVVLSHISSDGKWAIIHHPDEPDMQSCWGIKVDAEVKMAALDKDGKYVPAE